MRFFVKRTIKGTTKGIKKGGGKSGKGVFLDLRGTAHRGNLNI